MGERVRLIQASHQYMDQYVNPGSVDVICFNFGYLPGGDHRISTKADTSIEAIGKGFGTFSSREGCEPLYLQWRRYGV